MAAELTKTDPFRDARVRALAADLGRDDQAITVAAQLIDMDEATSAAAVEQATPPDGERERHD